MGIKKAVVLAAGLGTRVLPATKAVPKEMLMIVDKPAIQYIVEELAESGITDICIVISRGKETLQNHFDRSPELERALSQKGGSFSEEQLANLRRVSSLANIVYTKQQEPKGTADALLTARSFIGDDAFLVIYADDVFLGDMPASKEIAGAYDKYNLGIIAIGEFSTEQIMKYSSLKTDRLADNLYRITDMIEKPSAGQIFSHYAVLGRCALPPKTLRLLTNIKPGAGGELYLTDAMKELAVTDGMIGVVCESKRYDMGNKLGMMQAIVEAGLKHHEVGAAFAAYLKALNI